MIPIDRLPALAKAVAGEVPKAVREALERERVEALLLRPDATDLAPKSVGARLARYERVPDLRGLYLSRGAVLYVPDPVDQLPEVQREATAVVARALIGGARPPKPASFPEALRRVRPVEVMVLLRRGGRPRLWRSARGSSIASALVTAAVVARQRWQEREQAMGAPLDELLPTMDVEIALLEDDGTVGDREPAFIDRVFKEGHGVGYERKGAWRYLFPTPPKMRVMAAPAARTASCSWTTGCRPTVSVAASCGSTACWCARSRCRRPRSPSPTRCPT